MLSILTISFLSVLIVQIIHESTHAITILNLKEKAIEFNLFGVNIDLDNNQNNFPCFSI